MLPEMVFLGLGELVADFNLVIKIFVLMTIISFGNNHIENKVLKIVVVMILGYFILFDYWALFGGIYVLYMLLMIGISSVIVDLFFATSMTGGHETPPTSGKDIQSRLKQVGGAAHMTAKRMRKPPGMG